MEITKDQMILQKAMAETTMKISMAKAELFKLQEAETIYLVEREKRAMEKINQTVTDNQSLIDEAKNNVEIVQKWSESLVSFSDFLDGLHAQFLELLEDFNQRNDAWEKKLNDQLSEIAEMRKHIRADQIRITNDRKGIERREKLLADKQEVIESRQAQIKSALEILKQKEKNGTN